MKTRHIEHDHLPILSDGAKGDITSWARATTWFKRPEPAGKARQIRLESPDPRQPAAKRAPVTPDGPMSLVTPGPGSGVSRKLRPYDEASVMDARLAASDMANWVYARLPKPARK